MQEPTAIISPDLKHDGDAVHQFMIEVTDHLKSKRKLSLKREFQFTDGCGAQYKSRVPFADITCAKDDLGVTVERSFGSNHGKGPCDGLGAVVKQTAKMAVRSRQAIIENARDMFSYLHKNLTVESQPGMCWTKP